MLPTINSYRPGRSPSATVMSDAPCCRRNSWRFSPLSVATTGRPQVDCASESLPLGRALIDGDVFRAVGSERRLPPIRPPMLEAQARDARHEVHLRRPDVAHGDRIQ